MFSITLPHEKTHTSAISSLASTYFIRLSLSLSLSPCQFPSFRFPSYISIGFRGKVDANGKGESLMEVTASFPLHGRAVASYCCRGSRSSNNGGHSQFRRRSRRRCGCRSCSFCPSSNRLVDRESAAVVFITSIEARLRLEWQASFPVRDR